MIYLHASARKWAGYVLSASINLIGFDFMKIPKLFSRKAAKVVDKQDTKAIDYKILTGQLTDLDEIRLTAAQMQDRRTAYAAMKQLQLDAIMGPTFEIYATNATTTNAEGKVIWAEPTDASDEVAVLAAKAANARVAAWELDWRAYGHIKEIVCYGNLYLKTSDFIEPTDNTHVVNLNMRNPNKPWDILPGAAVHPGDIYELAEGGVSVGFVNEGSAGDYHKFCKINSAAWAVQNTDAVIHWVYNPSLYARDIEVNDAAGATHYQVVEGDPPFIGAYTPSQILSLLEDSLVANRVTRSALVRILQLEVGDCSSTEEDRALDRLQRGLEHKLAMSTVTGGAQSYSDPGPLEKIIYTVTRNGKGTINMQTLGGDVNVRDIVDLDYFKDKITSITDVSPGNLGQSTDEGGTGGATILTQNNIRLYRKVVTLQRSYVAGVKQAVETYFRKNNLEQYVGRFEMHMQKPVGPEDQVKSQLASEALNRANDILVLLDNIGIRDPRVKAECIKTQLNQIDSRLYSVISSDTPVLTEEVDGDVDNFTGR